MKLLFLDIDGVMTSNEQAHEKRDSGLLYPFSKGCVDALNEILRTKKVKIIITSSWRTVFDVEKQCRIFRENGVIQVPYRATVDLGYEDRSAEIKQWLRNKNIEGFVILDDMEVPGFRHNFLRIKPGEGLTRSHIPLINQILNIGRNTQ